jgi:hypothetical protein
VITGLQNASTTIFLSVLSALFQAIEQQSIEQFQQAYPNQYVKNGHESKPRSLRTSLGLFRYHLAQLYDKVNKRTIVPLRDNGFVPKYRQYTEECTEPGIGLAVHVSYRRSVAEVQRIRQQGVFPSASTLHRYLQEFAQQQCQWPELKDVPYRFLMVDGTSIRLQGPGGDDLGKGQMRWALASRSENEPFELVGVWVQKGWEQIRKDLDKRLDYKSLEVLFSDGGSGIVEALLAEGMRHQRCVWHGKRDFPYILYADGLKKDEQAPLKETLGNIPVFKMTKEKLERLEPEDLAKVKELSKETRQGFDEILDLLDPQKYPKARVYIENLSNSICTFFDWWLENKAWLPLNTNAIESAFSQVKNRVWSIGRRWSDNGLLNWLHVTVKKIFFPDTWKQIWSQYMSLNPNLKLTHFHVGWRWYCDPITEL